MRSRIHYSAVQESVEDDLSAMTGILNGLAIIAVVYSTAVVAWWLW